MSGAHAGESRLVSVSPESKSEAEEWNLRQAIFRIALVQCDLESQARERRTGSEVSLHRKSRLFLSFQRIQDLNLFSFCSVFSSVQSSVVDGKHKIFQKGSSLHESLHCVSS